MNFKKKLVVYFMLLILCLNGFSLTAYADFIESDSWQEISKIELNAKYNNNEPFVAMLYRTTCLNSKMRRTIIGNWLSEYDNISIYGVDLDTYTDYSAWISAKISNSYTLPVICIVKDSENYDVFTSADSMRDIQASLNEYLGVYAEGEGDFYTINNDIYNRYSTDEVYISGFLLADSSVIDSELVWLTESITAGLESDYDKLKAIHDWIADNISYDYDLYYNHSGTTSALGTYQIKRSVCAGYANLTAALCQATGIPCRVVSGYAVGVGSDSVFSSIWGIYEQYLADRDLAAFQPQIASNHAWNEAFVDGRWIVMDTTWDSGNEYYPNSGQILNARRDTYFDPSMEVFSAEHLMWAVYAPEEVLTPDITFNNDTLLLEEGNTTKLTVTGSYSGTVYWFTSDEDIVSVNNSGSITAVSEGTAVISASALVSNSYYKTVRCTITVGKAAVQFTDVAEGGWQYEPAKYVYEMGIMTGKGKDASGKVIFAPNDNLTRAEFAQILYSAEGKPDIGYEEIFYDVKADMWYTNAILWAAENGIVSGYGGGQFGTNNNIEREQLAAMLYKYAQYKGYDTSAQVDLNKFGDEGDISSWARTQMKWAVANGVMSGKGGILDPLGNATRAECAAMLRTFMNQFTQ